MSEKVEVQVDVEVDGAKTLSSLKKDLKEAQGYALAMSRQFGELSPEAQAAAKKVAQLKDEVGDLNERIALLDPGAKFKTFGNAVSAVAGGFAAAQGAMAVFGSESEDLQKTLVKLQGAMALSEGLSTISDSWKDFERLGATIKGPLIKAFSGLKGAIAATGIGVLLLVLGAVVANFEEIKKVVLDMFPVLGNLGKIFDTVKAAVSGFGSSVMSILKTIGTTMAKFFTGDFAGAVEAAKGLGEKAGEAYRKGFEDKALEIKLEKLAIKRRQQAEDLERELTKIEATEGKKRYDLRLQLNQKLQDALTAEGKWDSKELADNLAERSNILREQQEAADKAAKEAADKRKAAGEKALQELQRQQDLEYKATAISQSNIDEIKLAGYQQEKEMLKKHGKDLKEIQKKIDEELAKQAEISTGKTLYDLKVKQNEAQLALAKKYGLDTAGIQKQQADEDLSRREALNKGLEEKIFNHNGAVKTDLVNTNKEVEKFNTKNDEAQTQGRIRVEESEAAKRKAYEQTLAYLSFLSAAVEHGSELEQAAAFASAIAVQWAELSKQDAKQKTLTIVQTASTILGKETALGKGFAIAATAIDTYKAAQASFTSLAAIPIVGPALGAAAAIAAVAAGFARVKAITSIKVPGGGGSSGSAPSAAAMPAAPLVPTVQPGNGVLVDQMQQMNSNMNQPQRVVVLESDITDTQDRVAKIEANATF